MWKIKNGLRLNVRTHFGFQTIPFEKQETHENNDAHSIWIGWLVPMVLMAKISETFHIHSMLQHSQKNSQMQCASQCNATQENAIDENLRTTIRIIVAGRWWWFTALNFNYMHFEFFVHLITLKTEKQQFSVICVKMSCIAFRSILMVYSRWREQNEMESKLWDWQARIGWKQNEPQVKVPRLNWFAYIWTCGPQRNQRNSKINVSIWFKHWSSSSSSNEWFLLWFATYLRETHQHCCLAVDVDVVLLAASVAKEEEEEKKQCDYTHWCCF